MIKKLSMTGVFERINGLKPETRFNEQCDMTSESVVKAHSEPLMSPRSRNTEQSVSNFDTVKPRHCQNLTVSNPDTVTLMQQCQPVTLSESDTVKSSHCQSVTVSNGDTVDMAIGSKRAVKSNFTAVPNAVLRELSQFQDPVDFMIYMHLLTYSHGFGRETAAMGQTQLECFTGAAKNTVKKSLDRLVAQKFIKLVEEYEHSRTTRKWKVFLPETHKPDLGPEKPDEDSKSSTVSRCDSVKLRHCQDLTQTVSNFDTVTLSNFDTNKERDPKENFKENLSQERGFEILEQLPESLKKYFSELRPKAKRESEWIAFQELLEEYEPSEIEKAYKHLKRYGLPKTGESCHSPMAFLRIGINQVSSIKSYSEPLATEFGARFENPMEVQKPNTDQEGLGADLVRQIPVVSERKKIIQKLTADFPVINLDCPFAISLASRRMVLS